MPLAHTFLCLNFVRKGSSTATVVAVSCASSHSPLVPCHMATAPDGWQRMKNWITRTFAHKRELKKKRNAKKMKKCSPGKCWVKNAADLGFSLDEVWGGNYVGSSPATQLLVVPNLRPANWVKYSFFFSFMPSSYFCFLGSGLTALGSWLLAEKVWFNIIVLAVHGNSMHIWFYDSSAKRSINAYRMRSWNRTEPNRIELSFGPAS